MGDKEIITMKDIARDLGVSVATVSRALKDSSRISTAQKERIQKYAREHNFFLYTRKHRHEVIVYHLRHNNSNHLHHLLDF